jgi:hypothetical protein
MFRFGSHLIVAVSLVLALAPAAAQSPPPQSEGTGGAAGYSPEIQIPDGARGMNAPPIEVPDAATQADTAAPVEAVPPEESDEFKDEKPDQQE